MRSLPFCSVSEADDYPEVELWSESAALPGTPFLLEKSHDAQTADVWTCVDDWHFLENVDLRKPSTVLVANMIIKLEISG